MQVKLRLQRFGRKKKPYYRIVAAAITAPRDGKFLEILGLYHPIAAEGQQTRLKNDRILAWLNNGAQPTKTVENILKKADIWKTFAEEKETRRVAKIKRRNQRKKANKVKSPATTTATNTEES